jgi:hypothetical protein
MIDWHFDSIMRMLPQDRQSAPRLSSTSPTESQGRSRLFVKKFVSSLSAQELLTHFPIFILVYILNSYIYKLSQYKI